MISAASPEFQDQLTEFLPKMRIWALGCAIGTLKSRVHRARLQLRSEMSGEAKAAA
jgi:hypothetical protein